MKVTMRPIDSIRPYKNNPRLNDDAVAAVKASLQEFGWQQPIVVDKKGEIIVGHTRWRAGKELGYKEAPVVEATKLTPEQVKAYRLIDNKTNDLATWDDGKLAEELRQLKLVDWDMTAFGWTPEDLRGLEAQANKGLQAPDEVPPAPKNVKTRLGDIWQLGEHRLMCGSSISTKDVETLMAGETAAICATDPPYCIDYTGDRPKQAGKDWSGSYREIDIKDPAAFFGLTMNVIRRVLAPGAPVYVWHAHKRQAMLEEAWAGAGFLNHQAVIWVKPTPVFGRSVWHFRHEPCMMGWVQGSMPKADGNHEHDSVWRVGLDDEAARKGKQKVSAAETDVWEVDWEGKARVVGNEHPTQKPVELFARPIRRHTKPGAVCFEPFSGSGSQIIACEQTGRRCRAMELEPVFVEVAVRRWEAFTGKKGVRIPSPNGKTIVPPAAPTAPKAAPKASASRGGKNPKKPLKRGHRDVLAT